MKNILSIFFVLAILLFRPTTLALAQEATRAESSPSAVVDYKLPYPGMLPDNTFYVFKTLRDKLMILLIADPHKKAQYHLLLANKQILMSKQLIDKGKTPLAKEIALKGENQMTLMTFVYKNSGLSPTSELLQEARLATRKHQEILREIIAKISPEDATTFSTILEFSQRNIEELEKLAEDNE